MPKRTKAEVVKLIHDCAVLYDNNLAEKNVIFATVHSNNISVFETQFRARNYMHLTGVSSQLNSNLFFRAAFNNRLSTNDITLSPDGKTELKLDVLPQLMNIHRLARMIGDYNSSRPLLVADKFAGTVTMALGFLRVNDLYIPNTALKLDVRDITRQATQHRIIAIFVKPRKDALYKQLSYMAKGITIDDNEIILNLSKKVDFKNLTATFPIPTKTSKNN